MEVKETNQAEVNGWPEIDGIRTDPRLIQAREDYKKKHGSFEQVEFQFGIVEDEDGKHFLISSKFGPVCANNTDKAHVERLFESIILDRKNREAIFTLWEYPRKAISLVKNNACQAG
jgi:hypothetical protein